MTIDRLKDKLAEHKKGLSALHQEAHEARRRVAALETQIVAQHGSIAMLEQLIKEEEQQANPCPKAE